MTIIKKKLQVSLHLGTTVKARLSRFFIRPPHLYLEVLLASCNVNDGIFPQKFELPTIFTVSPGK